MLSSYAPSSRTRWVLRSFHSAHVEINTYAQMPNQHQSKPEHTLTLANVRYKCARIHAHSIAPTFGFTSSLTLVSARSLRNISRSVALLTIRHVYGAVVVCALFFSYEFLIVLHFCDKHSLFIAAWFIHSEIRNRLQFMVKLFVSCLSFRWLRHILLVDFTLSLTLFALISA